MKKSLSAAEFSVVFTKGITIMSYPVKMIAYIQQSEENTGKIYTAFTVPKRMIKKATARNRIKRQLRAAFQGQESVLRGTFLAKTKIYNLIFMYCDNKKEVAFTTLKKAIYENIKILDSNIE
jgi:ribonuclease P protein component